MQEDSHWKRRNTTPISKYHPAKQKYAGCFSHICKCLPLQSEPIDITQYKFPEQKNPISLIIANKNRFNNYQKLQKYSQTLQIFCKTLHTNDDQKLEELSDWLQEHNALVRRTRRSLRFFVDKYPQRFVCIVWALFTPNMSYKKFIHKMFRIAFKCVINGEIFQCSMPKFCTPQAVYDAIIQFITISSAYKLQPYSYQSAKQLQADMHSIYRWFLDTKFWRHNQDTSPPTYIAISSVNPKVICQLNQTFNMTLVYALFVIQFLLNIRHRVSNKNEFVHSILKSMCKSYGKNSLNFCLLLILIFIFHSNFCIINSLSTSQHYYSENILFISWIHNLYQFYTKIFQFADIFEHAYKYQFQIIRFFYQKQSFTTKQCIKKNIIQSPLRWSSKH